MPDSQAFRHDKNEIHYGRLRAENYWLDIVRSSHIVGYMVGMDMS
jgi:hypothetical protein